MTTKKLTKEQEAKELERAQKTQTEFLKKAFNDLVGDKADTGLTTFEIQLRVSYRHVLGDYVTWVKSLSDDLGREAMKLDSNISKGDFEDIYVSAPIQSLGGKLDSLAERLRELKNIINYYLAEKLFGSGNWK